jgi:hypothetical protein
MKELKCPACQGTIGLWTFAKAPTPWHLKCNHCKAKLTLGEYSGVTLVIALFGIFLAIYLVPLPSLLVLILAIIIFEVGGYLLLRKLGASLALKK